MKYIINEVLRFDAEEGVLFSVENNMTIEMSAIAVRLLSALLENSSGVTREYLLSAVWSDHGLIASNNNLNNHISLLRKSLDEIAGMGDLIKTLPKKGFVINKTYKIETLTERESEPDDITQPTNTTPKRGAKINKKSGIVFLMLMFISISSLYSKEIYYSLFSVKAERIYKYKRCALRTLQEIPRNNKKKVISMVIETIKKNEVDCDNDNYDIFFYLSGKEQRKNEFKMFSLCRTDSDGYYSSCYSIKMVSSSDSSSCRRVGSAYSLQSSNSAGDCRVVAFLLSINSRHLGYS
ncbi:winged helix-turn-helix domain-containing protein [Serratia aquatilis]|uniref:Transcriptional regulator n=1 Tax=Serratia aquatilis TaxID=1737515 RepID=A0ABV6EG47_9GAMM